MLARAVVRELPIASYVRDYAARIVLATQPHERAAPRLVRQFVSFGASPRGAQTLIVAAKARALLDQRYNVAFQDIRAVAPAALGSVVIISWMCPATRSVTAGPVPR